MEYDKLPICKNTAIAHRIFTLNNHHNNHRNRASRQQSQQPSVSGFGECGANATSDHRNVNALVARMADTPSVWLHDMLNAVAA
jgi:hypothetical protein